MTYQVLRSAIAGTKNEDFASLVKVHADNLKAYHRQLELHAKGEADLYPAPHSLPIIDQSVRRPDFVPDYTIVEDVPPPPSPLRAAQNKAIGQVHAVEHELISAIMPQGKWRLAGLKYEEAKAQTKKTAADRKIIQDYEAAIERLSTINRQAAELTSTIEDWKEVPEGWEKLIDKLRR